MPSHSEPSPPLSASRDSGAPATLRETLPTYAVAVLHYRDEGALSRCLASVAAQSHAPVATAVIDIDSDFREVLGACDVHRVGMPNRGYAGAGNTALSWLRSRGGASPEFLLLLTADVEVEPEFAERLLAETASRSEVAIATGKLLRRDAATIDSAGIRLPLHRRPRDRGSEQLDRGQFDRVEYVFGATGAALALRVSLLPELEVEGELFDADFFMYHEDTDLAWRAGVLGFKVLYVPAARAIHERGWKRAVRFEVPVELRRHSFKNHYLQWIKNESLVGLVCGLPIFLGWEVLRFGFACLRDREVLPAYLDAARLVPSALRKRRIIQSRAHTRERAKR